MNAMAVSCFKKVADILHWDSLRENDFFLITVVDTGTVKCNDVASGHGETKSLSLFLCTGQSPAGGDHHFMTKIQCLTDCGQIAF